jgi:flagellar hook-associated protein 3 FlgL
LATGLKVNKLSDNPLAARRAVSAQTEIRKNDQYLVNISTTSSALLETETSILTTVDLIQRARDLALQGNNSTNGQEQRDALANEVNQLLESVLVQGNHITNGRYVFGGTRTGSEPFEATRDASGDITAVSYEGNDENFQVEISEGVRVNANETGADVFTSTSASTVDIYQVLIDLRDDLRAGNVGAIDTALDNLGLAEDQLLLSTARVGALQNRFEAVDANLREISVQLEQVISDNIDADFAEVTLNLNAQSNAFQAALNAGARVIQPSLLSFIQ